MKKILFLICFFIFGLVISSCGGGEVKKQYSLNITTEGEGSVTVSPDSQAPLYDEGTVVSLEAVQASGWVFVRWEGSIESSTSKIDLTMNQDYSVKAVFVKVAQSLSKEQAENALHVVYGGIGYNDRQDRADDAMLYREMLDNINSIATDMILTTVTGDTNYLNKFVLFILIPISSASAEFKASGDGYTSVLKINRGALNNGYYSFDATLSVAFNGTGYTYATGKISGTGQDSDLTANFTGHFSIKDGSLDKFIIRTVRVTAGNGLKTVGGGVTTSYDNWNLAYSVNYGVDDPMGGSGAPINLGLIGSYNVISGDKTYADNRDYTVGGSFTINDKKFSFANGFRYEQKEYTYLKNNKPVPYIMMSANGWVSVPGLEGNISVSSSLDTINPETSGTIITHIFEDSAWSSDWLSGKLAFTTSAGDTSAVFNNGSVTFTSGAASWTVPNWKTSLILK